MAQLLRTLTGLSEDLRSVPGTSVGPPVRPAPGDQMSSGLLSHLHSRAQAYTHTHRLKPEDIEGHTQFSLIDIKLTEADAHCTGA